MLQWGALHISSYAHRHKIACYTNALSTNRMSDTGLGAVDMEVNNRNHVLSLWGYIKWNKQPAQWEAHRKPQGELVITMSG